MKQNAYAIANALQARYLESKYHLGDRLRARQALKGVEAAKGHTDPRLIRLSKEYASDVLGWVGFAPWLCVYSAISESFKEGWIPENYYGTVVLPITDGQYGRISDLKALSTRLFGSPAFPDIAYHVNGRIISRDYDVLQEDQLKDLLFENAQKVVYKQDESLQGKGVYFFTKASFDAHKLRRLGNGVFQSYIDQHPSLEELMPESVATLRITTVLGNEGAPSVQACYLRVGRSGDTHVQSTSHIRVPVHVETGKLSNLGYTPNWSTIDRHPDNQVAFAGRQIPCFEKCVHTAIELHRRLPSTHSIGWDMSVDKDHCVKVMEWDGYHNDIKFSEATQGPCFSGLGWENLWRKSNVKR